ncbi:hypothetical protein AOQ71_19530 [Bradyrhizobium manausense]|uniref:Uncharacterized protein n=1 Tax=Bradyrhizobium manausense TaxID=989370 RepID=A0A0R3DJZ2_9BRAD|nr:hypothetical protein AOQ71_19530 [Bradyrhizobium manausense]
MDSNTHRDGEHSIGRRDEGRPNGAQFVVAQNAIFLPLFSSNLGNAGEGLMIEFCLVVPHAGIP